jgi:biopolymer transport protein ExbD
MRRRLGANEPVEIILPVAAFLDMAFQLLAFFILTFHPASLEGQVEMALPASGAPRARSVEQADPTVIPDADMELQTELVVVVKTNQATGDGAIGSITVEDNVAVATEVRLDPVKDPALDALRDYLKQSQRETGHRDSIKIKAESALRHEFVIKVMDACAKAGFTRIGFAPPPDYKETDDS